MWLVSGSRYGGEYFAGFVTEKALSVDNLFVFVIIMAKFAVPRIYQQKVLLIGIVLALVMRGAFIAVGAAAIYAYSWVFYLFGAFLMYTAFKLVREAASGERPRRGRGAARQPDRRVVKRVAADHRNVRRRPAWSPAIDGKRWPRRCCWRWSSIGFTDVLFALDSIPAIYGLTQEPYLVFMANAFALMGLRQLYFLIGGLLDRLVYLSYGLSIVLGFIGVKLVLHALHENTLPFINGGDTWPCRRSPRSSRCP